jgi:hypothetical protein
MYTSTTIHPQQDFTPPASKLIHQVVSFSCMALAEGGIGDLRFNRFMISFCEEVPST